MINIADLLLENNTASERPNNDNPIVDYSDNHEKIDNDTKVEDNEPLEESGFIVSDDIYCFNFNKLDSGKTNILLVTGLSGSGKSTYASLLSKIYEERFKKKYIHFELDCLDFYLGGKIPIENIKKSEPGLYDFINKKKLEPEKRKYNNTETVKLYKEYIKYLISWCKKHKENCYIIEGIQIYETFEMGDTHIISQPLIILGTSALKSAVQGAIRNSDKKPISFFKNFKDLIIWGFKDEKMIKKLRNTMYNPEEKNVETMDIISKKNDKNRHFEKVKIKENTYTRAKDYFGYYVSDKGNLNGNGIDEDLTYKNEFQAIRFYLNSGKDEGDCYLYATKKEEPNTLILLGKININDKGEEVGYKFLEESSQKSTLDSKFKKKLSNNFEFIDMHNPKAKKYLESDKYYSKYFKGIMNEVNGEIVINIDDDKLAGYIYIGGGNKSKNKNYGFIQTLEVIKRYRGYGLSHTLLDDAIKKYNAVDLTCYKDNEIALNLYKKHGFVIIGHGNEKNNSDYYMKLKTKLSKDDKILKESSNNSELYPVYIVTSYTDTKFGKIIRKASDCYYTHAAISFESDLHEMYSFGNSGTLSNSKLGGMTCESLNDYIKTSKNAVILVSVVFVKEKDYKKLLAFFDEYLNNSRNTRYSYSNLFNVLKNKPISNTPSLSYICSQFVDSLFKFISIDMTNKPSNLVTPEDIANLHNVKPTVYKLFEGKAIDYNVNRIEKILDKMYSKAKPIKEVTLLEAKEFPIQFNDEGDLLISKKEKIDFLAEYNKSKKLRQSYVKYKNLEGLKYECCKMWYINTILMKLLDDKNLSHSDREDYNNYRSKILTEFSQYLKEIQKIDKSFNFGSYYETTPFSNTKIKINGSTIKYTTKLMKFIFK